MGCLPTRIRAKAAIAPRRREADAADCACSLLVAMKLAPSPLVASIANPLAIEPPPMPEASSTLDANPFLDHKLIHARSTLRLIVVAEL
jgi:hypothetical protein